MMRAGVLGAAMLAFAGMAMAQPAKAPAQGVLVSAEAGDIACYLGIRDDTGQSRRWMAEFELCGSASARIGRRYALTWREANVQHPDCQGNPDCRRTQRVLLVVGMKPL
jgi:hypothetical protein